MYLVIVLGLVSMGLRSWIIRKFISDKTVITELKAEFSGFLKTEIMNTIADEEVNTALIGLGDAYYNRYMSKFNGWLGGQQKGLNGLAKSGVGGQNPLLNEKLLEMVAGIGEDKFSMKELVLTGLSLLQQPSSNNGNGHTGNISSDGW